ncbi:3-hydroxyisobutyrate dehydrogenase [Mycena sanguinolenta]|uniref:3-hydroxyisobutyrate dehydrogenase n=1 Tax=Mycena sanguinolenta TaxID=230812 RepID=A0A8H7DJY5_9AGAR|nr:3-hydroxyisobutyrate dehydrogenase [Mycena sanguinolenta]
MPLDSPQHFGWVGLGAMGWPMCLQLLKNSSATSLWIFDVDESVLHRFATEAPEGKEVRIATDAKQVADESDLIFTIVPEGRQACQRGIIIFMCGIAADDEKFSVIYAILKTMGKSINPMGGRGLGLAAKLSNNYLSGIIALATSEAMNLGMKLGIDPKVLSDCLAQGSASNWVNSTVNPVPGVCPDAVTSKGYEGGFKVQLMEKDMKLAAKAAQNVGAKLILGQTAIDAYASAASDSRYRGKDSRVVYKWLVGETPRDRSCLTRRKAVHSSSWYRS